MLIVKNLSLGRTEYNRKALREGFRMENISFELDDGYIMALLGKNGSGKTTLFDLLTGNAAKKSGSISFDGLELTKKTRASVYSKMTYIGPPHWCLECENINVNAEVLGSLYEDFDRGAMEKYLEGFDFPKSDYEKKYTELSTGQKLQFSIAFALAHRPKLLLLDEPFANIDPVTRVDIADILQNAVRKEGISIIVSTHQVEEISEMTDYVGIMENGRMTRFGTREEVKTEWL